MRSKFDRYLGIIAIFAVLLANTALGFAESGMAVEEDFENPETDSVIDSTTDFEVSSEIVPEITPETDPDSDPDSAPDSDSISPLEKQELFLSRLKNELNLSKTDYYQVLNSIADANERLKSVTEEKLTLQEQLENLDDLITKTTGKLFTTIKQVVENENEIILLYEQIEIKETALAYQKTLLRDYIRVLYQEENNYFSIDENGEIDAFKLLLADGSVGDHLREIEYFDLLGEAGQQIADKLENLSFELQRYQKKLSAKREGLINMQKDLEKDKAQLDLQKRSKQKLLDLTLGQERVYAQLLEQTAAQQGDLLSDVKNLSNSVAFIEQKIAEEGANFNPDDYLSLLDYKTQSLYDFHLGTFGTNINGFVWPADPNRGLSAYFHDPGYFGFFGVQHNAIDIPIYQGSPLRAPADGVVYTTKDNGYGYSYIILAHAGGFMTVYGHVSTILVEEGQSVSPGAVIGLSGGMPGTKGAGYMTTGPHLHFEVLLNGLYVDPLNYLPMEILTEDQMEWLPEKYQTSWGEAVERSEFELIQRS